MSEVWKAVEGFSDYIVSSQGRLRNLKTGRELRGSINNHGYVRYDMMQAGKRIAKSGHQLVARAFIPCDNPNYVINHIDGNQTNNCVENLEWCSVGDNTRHAIHVLGVDTNHGRRRPVQCIETGEVFQSAYIAGRMTGISNGSINRCCRGIHNTAGGYHWKFIDADVA